jgi:magnesium transporter
MDTNVIFGSTTDDQEEIAADFKKYGLLSMPIVDKEKRLIGIITVDDIVHIIAEEATEDIEIMSALRPSEDPYMKTGIIKQSRNRIVWLMFLMLSATITGAIIAVYENALLALPLLAAFIPMMMDTAGNAGCQSSALIIRGMALGEVRKRDVLKVWWIEIRVSLLCGSALGLVNFVRVFFMYGRDFDAVMLGLTTSISMIATVLIAKSVGGMLPIFAKLIKIDPAVMAAPLITTIADGLGLIVFFWLATLILHV